MSQSSENSVEPAFQTLRPIQPIHIKFLCLFLFLTSVAQQYILGIKKIRSFASQKQRFPDQHLVMWR